MPLKTRDGGKKKGARAQRGKREVWERREEKMKRKERGEENINTAGRTRSLGIAGTENGSVHDGTEIPTLAARLF